MSFGEPLWFFALALLPALLVLFFRNERRREILLRQLVAARLRNRLAGSVSTTRRRWGFGVLLLGLACIILSLTAPRIGYTWEESHRKGRDVLIAIDCSRSMLATDLTPSRLGRAKLAAQDLIGQLEGDRVGLIAFAGTAFLQAPLTVDYGAVLNSLTELDTNIIPRGGTDIAAAIREATEAFGKGESDNRCLILFTDGEELEEDAVKEAEALNGTVRIFTVGLGSADGSLIPLPGVHGGTDFLKDENGQIVKSRLDEDRLRKIAEVTGGFYVHLQNGLSEVTQIAHEGLGKMKEKDIDVKMSRRPIERYQWPLAAGLALLARSMLIGERKGAWRRGASSVALALLAIFSPIAAQAKNDGLEAYNREDYAGAEEQFSNQLKRLPDSQALQFDLGAAAYKSGDFGKALESFAKAVTSSDKPLREAAEYNIGNTLFQRGAAQKEKEPKIHEWKNAIEHYDQALKMDPLNGNAKYNRDLIQRLIDELEKEEKQDKQQQQKDKKDDQKKDKDKDKDQKQDNQQQNGQGKQDQKNQQQGDQKDSQQNQAQNQKGGQQQQQDKQQSAGAKQDKGDQGQQQDKKDAQNSQQPKDGEQKNAQNQQPKEGKDGQQAQNQPQPKDGTQGQQASAAQDSQEKKHSGEIKAQGSQSPQNAQDPQQQEATEAQAAKEGKMTEEQAKQLLDSLKGEDQRVQLLKPNERKNSARFFKDW